MTLHLGIDRARAAFGPLALAFFLLSGAAPARAQEPLTRADSADVLVGAAERLDADGADELAAALARLVRSRYADTPAAARADALLGSTQVTRRDRSGRVELIAWGTLYGAWLGVAIPMALDVDSPEPYGLGLIAGAPLGFMGARAYTRDRSVSAGDARAITFGGTWGTWQGFGWSHVLDVGAESYCDAPDVCYEGDIAFEETVMMMVGGGVLGIAAGAIAANNTDIGAGTSTLINFGALWGSWYGVVAGVFADLDNEDDGMLTAALIGGDVGLAAMAVFAPRLDMSRNRARLINAAGVIGLAAGGGIDLLIQPQDENVAIGIPAIGSVLGLWLGAHMTRDYDHGELRQGLLEAESTGHALLELRDGDWRLGLPQPTPTIVRSGARASDSGLAVRVPMLDARF